MDGFFSKSLSFAVRSEIKLQHLQGKTYMNTRERKLKMLFLFSMLEYLVQKA